MLNAQYPMWVLVAYRMLLVSNSRIAPEIGRLELFPNPGQPVVAETVEVDAVLPVDPVEAR